MNTSEKKRFNLHERETPIGERFTEDINCPNCGGSGVNCDKCHGWGGLFVNPENNGFVGDAKQKEITSFWKNVGVERHGQNSIQIQGVCECGYENSQFTRNNPHDFTEAEKEIYNGHDYKTGCPHEPAINQVETQKPIDQYD